MSSRSVQLPAVTSVNVGWTKQASTPSLSATSFVVSMSNPVTSGAVIWFGRHLVSLARDAPSFRIDCGG
jgi:hypothetical protein